MATPSSLYLTLPTMPKRRLLTALLLIAACGPAAAWGQTTAPATLPAVQPVLVPEPVATQPAAPLMTTTTAPGAAEPAVQPFVGSITGDKVYVRSGPGVTYYELGQLNKGDLVQVVGQNKGWYQIVPPTGTFAYIAKELVETDPDGKAGTVKSGWVNVRAASAIHPNSEYAVLTVVKRGTKVEILGATDTYYKIVPPENAYVYVSPQFVAKAPAGTEYRASNLNYPGARLAPATQAAPERPDVLVVETPAPDTATQPSVTPQPDTAVANGTGTAATPGTTPPEVVVVTPQPAPTYNADAYNRFDEINARTVAEEKKPLLERDAKGLLADYRKLLEMENLPASVKAGSEARVAGLEKLVGLQAIAAEARGTDQVALEEQRKAWQEEWKTTEQKIRENEQSGPLLAQGTLQTSTAVKGKYVLVNPTTGRVVAYVDPNSEIDLSRLLGSYLGVRGTLTTSNELGIKIIRVRTATVMPAPEAAKPEGQTPARR